MIGIEEGESVLITCVGRGGALPCLDPAVTGGWKENISSQSFCSWSFGTVIKLLPH